MSHLISGRARDETGKAIADARVWIATSPIPMTDIAAFTGADGLFVISVPKPGTYAVRCFADGFTLKEQTLSIGDEQQVELDFVLERTT